MKEKATYGVKFKNFPVGTKFKFGGKTWLKIFDERTRDIWVLNMETCSIPLENEFEAETIVYPCFDNY